MCDEADGRNDIERRDIRRARKSHTCYGCEEPILPGHSYVNNAVLYDRHWSAWKHCLRCDAMMSEILSVADEYETVDPGLNCGETWHSASRGPLPEHVAALAFWIPGDPIPAEVKDHG